MPPKTCKDCRTPVSGRRRRCPACRQIFRAKRERERYHSGRNQDAERYEFLGDEEVVDYCEGGEHRPRLDPDFPYRQNPRHDAVTRRSLEDQESADDDAPDQATWKEMRTSFHADERTVAFPPNLYSPAVIGSPFWSHDDPGQPVNPAAAGMLYRPSPAAGQRAVAGQRAERFGGKVRMDAPIHSGQLDGSVPHLAAREQVQAEQQRLAGEHTRSLAPSWRRR